MKPRTFRRLWLWILTVLAVLEVWSLVDRRPGDTLSEYTRSKIGHPLMRAALGGLLFWLPYHWLFVPNGSGMGALDGIFAGLGVVAGLGAHVYLARRKEGR